MSEEKKDIMNQVSEKATEAFGKAKEVGANVAEKFKESAVGKEILGEDGKLGKEDLKRMGDDFAETKVGKAILGEDGKFDMDDVNRIKDSAVDAAKAAVGAAKGAVDKVKDMIGSKDE
ncbi:MAG: hypothetical protein Q4C20_05890 [Erysipelotrichaceae bacterium]|nr:hypothetical protein [Erysipelotrichaceae bacterium]